MTDNAIYNVLRGHWAFLHDMYQGGFRLLFPSSTVSNQCLTEYVTGQQYGRPEQITARDSGIRRSYLVPYPGESLEEFDTRVKLAVYINICQPIVDAYVDAITPGVKRELGMLDAPLSSLDGNGQTWELCVDDVARWTSCYGMVATVLDAPRVNPSETRAAEAQSGTGLRIIVVHPPAIAWVVIGDDGQLDQFAYRETAYVDLSSRTIESMARVWVWTRTEWMLVEGTVRDAEPIAGQQNKLNPVPGMRGPHGTPGKVPVEFCFFKRDSSVTIPLGISPIDDAAKAGQLVYNELSRIEEYHRKAPPFLAIPEKEASGVLPPETKVTVGPDTAFGYSSQTGAPSWVSPPADMPNEIRTHCVFVIQASYRSAGLELSADTSAQVQSGEALRIRSRDFESRCRRFAMQLKGWEERMLSLAALWLKMPDPQSRVTYPDRYVLPDRAEDLAQAVVLVNTFASEMGPSGKIATLRQAVNAALTLSDDDAEKIINEAYSKLLEAPKTTTPTMGTDAPGTS